VYQHYIQLNPYPQISIAECNQVNFWLVRCEAQITIVDRTRPTSRANGKEGRLAPPALPPHPAAAPRASPDRNVLMYLRTGSAGPTPPLARIVGRSPLEVKIETFLELGADFSVGFQDLAQADFTLGFYALGKRWIRNR
jgi:hypothetical protein